MSAEAPSPDARIERQVTLLSTLAWPMLGLVVVQFLLGMALNLYATLPSGSALTILASSPLLIAHIVVAVLLVGITIRATFLARQTHNPGALVAGVLGLVSTLVAVLAGFAFVFGTQSPAASYVMTVGFAGLVVAAFLLLRARERPSAEGAVPREPAGTVGRASP